MQALGAAWVRGDGEEGQWVAETLHARHLTSLLLLSPLLWRIITSCKWRSTPITIIEVAFQMQQLARLPLRADPLGDFEVEEGLADYEAELAFAPHHPLIRRPGAYVADEGGNQSEPARDEVPCTKHRQSHMGLTPGLIAMFCPHGLCQAFKMMTRSEGPRTVFDLIYHRFPQGENTENTFLRIVQRYH
jgi:hypothetical protein